MKKSILITAFAAALMISSCSSDKEKEKLEPEEKTVEQTEKPNGKDASESKPELQNPAAIGEGDIRFKFDVKGTDGKLYTISLKAMKEETFTEENGWAGAQAGDIIYKGDYEVMVAKGLTAEKQKLLLKDVTFNASRNDVRVIKGTPDLLLVSQFEATNTNMGKVYVIHNGELVQLTNDGKMDVFAFTNTAFKDVMPKQYQTAYYENMEGTWTFVLYKLDEDTLSLKPVNVEKMAFEEGSNYYETYFADK